VGIKADDKFPQLFIFAANLKSVAIMDCRNLAGETE